MPTVILEELAFRRICYQKAVELSGVAKANLVFATVFIMGHRLKKNTQTIFQKMAFFSATICLKNRTDIKV
ncbi:hypothetical protein [Ferruginibacter sp.]|uniref:hypothetical protein n=1 Tax=Ferruginibacter sp. TaxID=1940288 RepID=UPI003467697E